MCRGAPQLRQLLPLRPRLPTLSQVLQAALQNRHGPVVVGGDAKLPQFHGLEAAEDGGKGGGREEGARDGGGRLGMRRDERGGGGTYRIKI